MGSICAQTEAAAATDHQYSREGGRFFIILHRFIITSIKTTTEDNKEMKTESTPE